MKQEADHLIFSRVSVEVGVGSGGAGRGGEVRGAYFTNEDTLIFTSSCTDTDMREINRISPMHLNVHGEKCRACQISICIIIDYLYTDL